MASPGEEPTSAASISLPIKVCKGRGDSGNSEGIPVPLVSVLGIGVAGIAAYLLHRYISRKGSTSSESTELLRSQTAASALSRAWLAVDPDPATRAEVLVWTGDLDALDPSSSRLRFGTAGVRAAVGAGYDKLNAVTVTAIAQAVCVAMNARGRVVVVSYDARHSSRKFAILFAQVLAHYGASRIHFFSSAVATPVAAFAGSKWKAALTIVVTASHNPPSDNGIKVFGDDAMQLRPDAAAKVEAALPAAMHPWTEYSITTANDTRGVVVECDPPVEQYVQAVLPAVCLRDSASNARAPPAVYTACHGVGYEFIKDMFKACGLPDVIPVEEQCTPDGDFPTLPFPNPEESGALDLAIQTARARGASLVLANDPDADRFAAAEVGVDGVTRTFSGDEIAALLTDYITSSTSDRAHVHKMAVVTSLVSSKVLAAMAKSRGFSFHESLTGFKYLNKTAVDLQQKQEKIVIMTYEEAIGFNVTRNAVRDKDGISAAALFYEMAGYLYNEQKTTLTAHLREIIDECGVHIAKNGFLRLSDESPRMEVIFENARADGLPSKFGDADVVSYRDLTKGEDTAEANGKAVFPADASSQFITFRCAKAGTRTNTTSTATDIAIDASNCPLTIHLRGSGTEPKIKFYSELRCSTVEANNGSGKRFLEESVESAIKSVLRPDVNHLTR